MIFTVSSYTYEKLAISARWNFCEYQNYPSVYRENSNISWMFLISYSIVQYYFGSKCIGYLFMIGNRISIGHHISRNGQYNDVCRRTKGIPQRARIFEANCRLKVHNAHLKLALPISGYVTKRGSELFDPPIISEVLFWCDLNLR